MEGSSSITEARHEEEEEELGMEDVWSDLLALKNLYRILLNDKKKKNVSQDQTNFNLDDRSRLLLRKLLDSATQEALQCQSKIVLPIANPIQSAASLEEAKPKEPQSLVGLRERDPDTNREPQLSFSNLPAAAEFSAKEYEEDIPVAKPQLSVKACPVCENSLSMSSKNLQRRLPNPSRRVRHDRNRASIGHPSGNAAPEIQSMNGYHVPSSWNLNRARPPFDSAQLAPCQKRSRVEPTSPLVRALSNKSRNTDLTDGNLNWTKGSQPDHKQNGSSIRSTKTYTGPHPTIETGGSCHTDQRVRDGIRMCPKFAPVHHDGVLYLSDSKTKPAVIHPSRSVRQLNNNRGFTRLEKPSCYEERCTPQRKLTRAAPVRMRQHSSRLLNQVGSRMYSPSSCSTQSWSSSSSSSRSSCSSTSRSELRESARTVNRRSSDRKRLAKAEILPCRSPSRHLLMPTSNLDTRHPRRMMGQHLSAGPGVRKPTKNEQHKQHKQVQQQQKQQKAKIKNESKEEVAVGSVKKLKNKLALVLHHHHHHHHHHSSLWTYIKSLLHHSSVGERSKNINTAAVEHDQHGYLHAMFDSLLRHLWGTRQQRAAKAEKRRLNKTAASGFGKKKLHWWQRRRRKGGVKLGSSKKKRLMLGFRRNCSHGRR